MQRQLRKIGSLFLLLALGALSYAVTDRVYDPSATQATSPPARTGEVRAADDDATTGDATTGDATKGRAFEDVAPVALVGGLLLAGGLFLLTLTLPTSAERRRAAAQG
jgi:hypothetical protein